MPNALLPAEPDGTPWYSDEELEVVRLSSKSHWDLPIEIGRKTVHSPGESPDAAGVDGPEDRSRTRNHDEIRFWADYIHSWRSHYIYDDDGETGGLARRDLFVIAGDQNSDPNDGDSITGAIQQLVDNRLINTKVVPSSAGAVEQAELQGDNNVDHLSNPAFDTADFGEAQFGGPGNLRVDHPGAWLSADGIAVDLMVPEELAGAGSRGARANLDTIAGSMITLIEDLLADL